VSNLCLRLRRTSLRKISAPRLVHIMPRFDSSLPNRELLRNRIVSMQKPMYCPYSSRKGSSSSIGSRRRARYSSNRGSFSLKFRSISAMVFRMEKWV
jgi:hypothetical protein